MKRSFTSLALAAAAALTTLYAGAEAIARDDARAGTGSYISVPIVFSDASGHTLAGENGLLVVAENRRNPRSRTIAVRFLRFPATNATARRPPIVLLPGGPGSEFDFSDPVKMRRVERMRRMHDVIYVSQRGNPDAPRLGPDLRAIMEPTPLDQPSSAAQVRTLQRAALQRALDEWSSRGVDLSGYDILNIVDDVHELRAALGYERIILNACSFGSQWSLAYLKRWPQFVDRALLSGVEPLDYAYDSPAWLWASLLRLAKMAEADPRLAPSIPAGGILPALQRVIERLEKTPEKVTIEYPSSAGSIEIVIGADDLRQHIADANSFLGRTKRENLANWPRFIIELSRGDYRFIAALRWEQRIAGNRMKLILPLIDNSLGISARRDAALLAEPAARWLGDINDLYHNTRDLTPTPNVGDAFRADSAIDVPVLLVHGDLDWSTPIENAEHLRSTLERGHLMRVGGGTHCSDEEMPSMLPQREEELHAFLEADFGKQPAEQFFRALPDAVTYPALAFNVPEGPSLYEQWLARKRGLSTIASAAKPALPRSRPTSP